jgi:PLP dependent protein
MTKEQATFNLDQLITNIESSRLSLSDHHIVKTIAVSKYSTIDDIKMLYSVGQRAFGENKVQDLKEKSKILNDLPIQWHFIGRLQKNKINNLIDLNPSLFHSLDSEELAYELNNKLLKKNKTMNCLLQINSANEKSQTGVEITQAIKIYDNILKEYKNINLKGIMSIGANTNDKEKIIDSFKLTHNIFKKLESKNAKYCSMGMSNDYQIAIKCGSNMIRVGSTLFKNNT